MNEATQAKLYQLPLTRDYVRSWTAIEACREIIQNAIDHCHGKLHYQINSEDGLLRIHSPDAFLEARTLLLGATSKADDRESIGSFGEGYKIALLVLAREGVDVKVLNGPVCWTPKFIHSEDFNEEVLCIEESDLMEDIRCVTFEMRGLDKETLEAVRENTLQMQPDFGMFHRVVQGDILLERPGKLYVNGLFVCETGMKFGYNVKPAHIQLERDRQTVSSWDLQWLTKSMWFATGLHSEVAQMMADKVKDVEYAQYNAPELVKEACYKLFTSKHPGAVVATSQQEVEELVKSKMVREVVTYGSAFAETVRAHPDYASRIVKQAALTPKGELDKFFKEWNKSMSNSAKAAFSSLIERSKSWK